jgi:EAL domain-containing protein (putative c-di-GMP-specific phosphodiesterase class I)
MVVHDPQPQLPTHGDGGVDVAEGVDDAAVLPALRCWGCDIVQGFLFFKPEPLERVPKAVRRDRPRALPDPL